MREPDILTLDDIAKLESRIQETIYKGEWWASTVESPSYQAEHAGEYVDWLIRVRRSEVDGLIATIRKLQSDFGIVDTELSRQERENERLLHLMRQGVDNCPMCHGTTRPDHAHQADCYCLPMRKALGIECICQRGEWRTPECPVHGVEGTCRDE